MADNNKKKKIKAAVKKLKEAKEKLGEEKIKNISRPGKVKPTKGKEREPEESGRRRKQSGATSVGPRGGAYKVSASGEKIYESSREERVKKSMVEYLKHIEAIDRFINKFKEFKGLL